ncbi:MAG: T9SS type A sorting domain-containing protein [Flavobacteriales bacterium]|nr:T9SS type A sorting domain-containing protein [Flavobacteriales bacterium]
MRSALLLLAILPFTVIGQVIYSQNFDGIEVGQKIAAVDPVHWRTWSDPPGPTEDAPIQDSLSQSIPNSLSFIQSVVANISAPRDVALLLGYHLAGSYVLSWSMNVHDDGGALITLLHTEDIPSAAPAAIFAFYPAGTSSQGPIEVYANGEVFTGNYPRNTWFTVTIGIDLDSRLATLSIDNTQIGSWEFDTMPSGTSAPNILGAVRFIAQSGSWLSPGRYHIDDVVFRSGVVGIHEVEAVRPLAMAPNPTASGTVLSMDMPASNAQVEVHDASGRVVWQAAWPAGAERYTLPAGTLAAGAYVVQVASGLRGPQPSQPQGTSATAAGATLYTGRLVVMP